MINFLLSRISRVRARMETARKKRWWAMLRSKGMKLGKGVNLPFSTKIDVSHCCLISIGDNCGFGEDCVILAHDAMPNEYLDATVLGRVDIRQSCHFGVRTVILPGVTIGPRSVVGANSVVTGDIPPDCVAVGNPAKVVCSLEQYLERHRQAMKHAPLFEYAEYDQVYLTPQRMADMISKLMSTKGYMVGGYTALRDRGEGTERTE